MLLLVLLLSLLLLLLLLLRLLLFIEALADIAAIAANVALCTLRGEEILLRDKNLVNRKEIWFHHARSVWNIYEQ